MIETIIYSIMAFGSFVGLVFSMFILVMDIVHYDELGNIND